MSPGAEALLQAGVETVFAGNPGAALRNADPQAPEPGRGDQDKKRAISHLLCGQVGQPLLDQFLSGK